MTMQEACEHFDQTAKDAMVLAIWHIAVGLTLRGALRFDLAYLWFRQAGLWGAVGALCRITHDNHLKPNENDPLRALAELRHLSAALSK